MTAAPATSDTTTSPGSSAQPISAYWAWKEEHGRGERFPHGESLDDAVRRYADALRRLLGRSEAVTLIVGHELAIRYIVEARPPRASWSPAKPTQPKGDRR